MLNFPCQGEDLDKAEGRDREVRIERHAYGPGLFLSGGTGVLRIEHPCIDCARDPGGPILKLM